MTRLLVSVRNAAEAAEALEGGAQIIDVKEPTLGSLGAAEPGVIADVLRAVAGRAEVSAALGELADREALVRAAALPDGVAYAKFGLAGCVKPSWPNRWCKAILKLPRRTRPVGVVYADWREARAPKPLQSLKCAQQMFCRTLLIDTWDKQRGGLLDLWQWESLVRFTKAVKRRGIRLALAGQLQLEDVARLDALEPDYYAVRGAVCRAGRASEIDAARVRQWRLRIAPR